MSQKTLPTFRTRAEDIQRAVELGRSMAERGCEMHEFDHVAEREWPLKPDIRYLFFMSASRAFAGEAD